MKRIFLVSVVVLLLVALIFGGCAKEEAPAPTTPAPTTELPVAGMKPGEEDFMECSLLF